MLQTNLRDARNHALREKLLSGALSVEAAVNFSSEELAPPEVAKCVPVLSHLASIV